MSLDSVLEKHSIKKAWIAEEMGELQQTISGWRKRGVPAEKVLPFVRAAKSLGRRVFPFEIRPDLYPDPDWLPPDMRKRRRKKAS